MLLTSSGGGAIGFFMPEPRAELLCDDELLCELGLELFCCDRLLCELGLELLCCDGLLCELSLELLCCDELLCELDMALSAEVVLSADEPLSEISVLDEALAEPEPLMLTLLSITLPVPPLPPLSEHPENRTIVRSSASALGLILLFRYNTSLKILFYICGQFFLRTNIP